VEQRRQLTRLAFQKTYTQALRRDLQTIVGDAEGPSDGSDIAARLDMIAEHIGRVQDSIAVRSSPGLSCMFFFSLVVVFFLSPSHDTQWCLLWMLHVRATSNNGWTMPPLPITLPISPPMNTRT
jgi:hypothetical protein